jgi:hypothetical protein
MQEEKSGKKVTVQVYLRLVRVTRASSPASLFPNGRVLRLAFARRMARLLSLNETAFRQH